MTKTREQIWTELRGKIRMAAVAKDIGVTRGYIAQWKFVPDKFVRRVAEITGIPQTVLRPDRAVDPWESLNS